MMIEYSPYRPPFADLSDNGTVYCSERDIFTLLFLRLAVTGYVDIISHKYAKINSREKSRLTNKRHYYIIYDSKIVLKRRKSHENQ